VAVTVIPIGPLGILPVVTHETGTSIDVDFDHLYVFAAAPDVPVASYAKGQWLSAVVS
jgi:hypothetical protein